MNKDEALKMAIEALQNNQVYDCEGKPMLAIEEANENAIQACKEALEQPTKEPYGYEKDGVFYYKKPDDVFIYKSLYTHPAPSWQGLTQEEQWNLINKSDIPADYDHEILAIARAIEQALKEKNHG